MTCRFIECKIPASDLKFVQMATQELTIPMFPLNLVILPGETKPIHIFEERYKQLINDCLQNNAHFGIPYVESPSSRWEYGMEVRITKVLKIFDNGEMDVMIEGVRPFRVIEFSSVLFPKLYGAAMIKGEDISQYIPSYKLQDMVKEYVWISQQKVVPEDAFDHANIYTVARLLDITNQEKFKIISSETLFEKEEFIKQKIKLFIHLIKTESELQTKFVLN